MRDLRTHRAGRHARPLRSARTAKARGSRAANSSLGLGPRVSSVPTFQTGGTQHGRAFVPPDVRSALPSASTLPTHASFEQRVPHRRALLGIHNTTGHAPKGLPCTRAAAVGTHDHCGRHARPKLAVQPVQSGMSLSARASSVPTVRTEATQQTGPFVVPNARPCSALLKPSTTQTHTGSELRKAHQRASLPVHNTTTQASQSLPCACLLYTSEAADE